MQSIAATEMAHVADLGQTVPARGRRQGAGEAAKRTSKGVRTLTGRTAKEDAKGFSRGDRTVGRIGRFVGRRATRELLRNRDTPPDDGRTPAPTRSGRGKTVLLFVAVLIPVLACWGAYRVYLNNTAPQQPAWVVDSVVKAGKVEPVVFTVGGDHGLKILQPGFPSSRTVDCDSGQPVPDGGFEPARAAKAGLTFDKATGRYTWSWQTDRAWAGTCRSLYLGFTEDVPDVGDAMLVVNFSFT